MTLVFVRNMQISPISGQQSNKIEKINVGKLVIATVMNTTKIKGLKWNFYIKDHRYCIDRSRVPESNVLCRFHSLYDKSILV